MTALLVLQTANLNQVVTIQPDAVNEVRQYQGSSAQLVVGDKVAVKDLLYRLMLPSGDDAAIRDGKYLIGVVLNDTTNPNQRFIDATSLLNWGFAYR